MLNRKITWVASTISLSVCIVCILLTTSSFSPSKVKYVSPGCYNPYTVTCNSLPWQGGAPPTAYMCNFTGVYGPPYNCTQTECGQAPVDHKCVAPE